MWTPHAPPGSRAPSGVRVAVVRATASVANLTTIRRYHHSANSLS